MTQNEFDHLDRGDLVRHIKHSECMLVDANNGNGTITVVNTQCICNPSEWYLIAKANYIEPKMPGTLAEFKLIP